MSSDQLCDCSLTFAALGGTTKVAGAAAAPDAGESRSFDNLVHFLMTKSTDESRRNSTGSLRVPSASGFRVPQACRVLFCLARGYMFCCRFLSIALHCVSKKTSQL